MTIIHWRLGKFPLIILTRIMAVEPAARHTVIKPAVCMSTFLDHGASNVYTNGSTIVITAEVEWREIGAVDGFFLNLFLVGKSKFRFSTTVLDPKKNRSKGAGLPAQSRYV